MNVWTSIFITAAALCSVLILWGLLAERIVPRTRRRRRCLKCRYDMSHTPGLRCSECGWNAKHERQLFTGRTRWRWIGATCLLAISVYAIYAAPQVRERGWVAAPPTTLLILALPWAYPDTENSDAISTKLFDDLRAHRIAEYRLWHWQEWLVIERAVRGDRKRQPFSDEWKDGYCRLLRTLAFRDAGWDEDTFWRTRAQGVVELDVKTRDTWPVGVPIYVRPDVLRWDPFVNYGIQGEPRSPGLEPFGHSVHPLMARVGYDHSIWTDRKVSLGPAKRAGQTVEYDLTASVYVFHKLWTEDNHRPVEVRQWKWKAPVEIQGELHEFIEPVHDPELDRVLLENLQPSIHINAEREQIMLSMGLLHGRRLPRLDESVREWLPAFDGITLGLDMTVFRDDEPIAHATKWFHPWSRVNRDGETVWRLSPHGHRQRIRDIEAALPRDEAEAAQHTWTLRIRGDGATAMRHFDAERYWTGDITLPLDVTARPPSDD